MTTGLWDVGVVILTWVVAAAVNYGIIAEKIKSLGHRVERLEEGDQRYITRTEYDGRHADLIRMMGNQK